MIVKQRIFRIVLVVVGFTHCLNFFDISTLTTEEFSKISFELADLDLNESDSEEREEELKVFDYDTDKFHSLAIYFIKSNFSNTVFYCLEKIQAPFLSIPYSPPEAKI